MATDTLLACSRLEIGFRGRAILPPIDLQIGRGEFWAIVGRNGSGKTTLLKTILGLLPAVAGKIERRDPHLRLAHVPQRSSFDDIFPLRARDVVRMGVERDWSFWKPRLSEPMIVARALIEVQAKDLAPKMFRSLSEGQKQRVLLARLIASEPNLAFLDEPTAAMDVVAENEALALLSAINKRHGTAIVVVTHGLKEISAHADHALLLDRDTQSVFVGSIDEVLKRAPFSDQPGEGSCRA